MVLGLDLGSSSVKALRLGLRGGGGRLVRWTIATRRGRGGRVEQDAEAILRRSIEALRSAAGAGTAVGGETPLGIATQRSTVLFWDRDDGRPLTPAYSWQDLRGAPLCERIVRRGRAAGAGTADPAALVARRTGLRLSPHYSASKLAWAMAHVPGLRRKASAGRALWGTLGSFLLFRLSGGAFYALDHANAQRTSLLDLGTLSWDPDLFVLFGLEALLDAPALPALVPTFPSAQATLSADGLHLRLAASTGDQQGALLGLGCRRPGDLAINYGSGAFVLENVGARPVHAPGLLTTLLASWREERAETPRAAALYALEGTVNAAATAIDWARRRLRLRVHTADLDRFLGPDDGRPRRLHFLPAISGTGAPRWDPRARPRFAGSLSGATPRDLLRAVVESIAYRCAEIVRAAEAHARSGSSRGKAPSRSAPVLVAGGA